MFWYPIFTHKFIAPLSSDPSLGCNYKTEVLPLVTLQGSIVFLRPRSERAGTLLLQQPSTDYGWDNSKVCTMAHETRSLLADSGHFGLEDELENRKHSLLVAASHLLHNIAIFKTMQGRKRWRGHVALCTGSSWHSWSRFHEAVRSAT